MRAWRRKTAPTSTPAMDLSSLLILAGAGSAMAHTSSVEVPANLSTRALGRVSDSAAKPPPPPSLASLSAIDPMVGWPFRERTRPPVINSFGNLSGLYAS